MSQSKQPLHSPQEQDTVSLNLQNFQFANASDSKTKVIVEFGAQTHPGRVRTENEDHYLIVKFSRQMSPILTNVPKSDLPFESEEATYGLVIADGMGGKVGGEVASKSAIQTLMALVMKAPKWVTKMNEAEAHELMERALRYFKRVDSALTEKAKSDPGLEGMGTTLTAAYNTGRDAFIIHVGDSRAYLYRASKLYQLTRDQTVAQALADAGTIAPDEVSTHPLRHMLTNAIGYRAGQVEAEIQQIPLYDGDRLLLCSDGLSEMVDDAAIAATLENYPVPSDACNALVNLALENGGKDNVTVLIASYRIPG